VTADALRFKKRSWDPARPTGRSRDARTPGSAEGVEVGRDGLVVALEVRRDPTDDEALDLRSQGLGDHVRDPADLCHVDVEVTGDDDPRPPRLVGHETRRPDATNGVREGAGLDAPLAALLASVPGREVVPAELVRADDPLCEGRNAALADPNVVEADQVVLL